MAQGQICSSEHFPLRWRTPSVVSLIKGADSVRRPPGEIDFVLVLFLPAFVLAHERDHHALNF